MPIQDPSNTILVLHDPYTDPIPFISRLIASPAGPDDTNESDPIPWHIENKYYTAKVFFCVISLDESNSSVVERARNVGVIIYLFSGTPPNPLPGVLIKCIMDEERDIALAIRISPNTTSESKDTNGSTELKTWDEEISDMEELFDELGMEFVDECAQPEQDDERPISPLESIRQTLMTHLWPGMVRKPSKTGGVDLDSDDELDVEEPLEVEGTLDSSEEQIIGRGGGGGFPVTFRNEIPEAGPSNPRQSTFPDLEELKAGLQDEWDGSDGALGDDADDFGPGEGEYARLEEWLEGDEEFGEYAMVDPPEGEGSASRRDTPPSSTSERHVPKSQAQFEDDFTDLTFPLPTPHQPPPPASSSIGRGTETDLDPTPLLMHLQSVRAELAGVEDEDERRVRAGREVERVMRGLGMGIEDLDLLGLDED